MVPTKIIDDQLATLLANDATTLAPAVNANHVHLIKAPFVPSPNTDFTTLVEAAFTGSAPLSAALGPQQAFNDPTTGMRVVQLVEPLGGWHWQCTVTPGTPETIYGYAVTNNANTVTYGSQLFSTPITIAAVNDAIDIPEVKYNIPVGMIN